MSWRYGLLCTSRAVALPLSAGRFLSRPCQHVADAQLRGEAVQVRLVETASLHLQHPQDVRPLLVRGLVAEAIPAQLEEDHVLRRQQVDRRASLLGKAELDAPSERYLLEGHILA